MNMPVLIHSENEEEEEKEEGRVEKEEMDGWVDEW